MLSFLNPAGHTRFVLLLLIGTTFSTPGFTQTGTVRGRILDARNRLPLPGVHVVVPAIGSGTTTNGEGRFELARLSSGAVELRLSLIGYRPEVLDAVVRANDVADLGDLTMTEEAIQLHELVVTPGSFSIMDAASLSGQTLTSEDLKNMSWAEDVTRAVARLPGISSSDFSSKFTIRGGESDEVLMTLDGMELYEPFHQRDFAGGLFSIVDVETIQGIDLMTGGFGVAFGDRLSGVFNMRTKSISPGHRHTSAGVSFMTARLYTDGSFADGRGSYLFSGRRGMLDVLFGALPAVEEATIDQSATPTFYDAMGKVDYALSPRQTVSLHLLQAGDRTRIRDIAENGDFDRNDTRYGNTYGWLTLKSTFTPDLYARSLLYSGFIDHNRKGAFQKNEPGDKGVFSLTDERAYLMLGIKQDWSWNASNDVFLTGGLDARHMRVDYRYFSNLEEIRIDSLERLYDYRATSDLTTNPTGQHFAAYLSSRIKIRPKLALEGGIRHDRVTYTNDRLWSPRLALALTISKQTIARAAWGYYYQSQFINDLDINHGNLKFDPAQLARHYVVGFEHRFASEIHLRVEGYYKGLSHYSPQWQNLRDHLEVFPEARNDNVRVILDGAESRGIEIFARRDAGGPISWWLSYGLAKATDNVRRLDFDGLLIKRTGSVPRLNDQRHTVYADVNYRPTASWHFNLSWQYYRGWPRTTYTFLYQPLPDGELQFYAAHKAFNDVIYPAYHRMDLRINRRFATRSGVITGFLHLINLYNRQNLKKFDLDTRDDAGNYSLDADGRYVPFHDDKYWFGFMPVLGASWEF